MLALAEESERIRKKRGFLMASKYVIEISSSFETRVRFNFSEIAFWFLDGYIIGWATQLFST